MKLENIKLNLSLWSYAVFSLLCLLAFEFLKIHLVGGFLLIQACIA